MLKTIEFNMAVQWWQHGVCVVCAKQTYFAKCIITDSMSVNPPRLVANQTCWNSWSSFVVCEGSLSLMVGRAVGWMEWIGAVKGWAGVGGGGLGRGKGEGGWGGE